MYRTHLSIVSRSLALSTSSRFLLFWRLASSAFQPRVAPAFSSPLPGACSCSYSFSDRSVAFTALAMSSSSSVMSLLLSPLLSRGALTDPSPAERVPRCSRVRRVSLERRRSRPRPARVRGVNEVHRAPDRGLLADALVHDEHLRFAVQTQSQAHGLPPRRFRRILRGDRTRVPSPLLRLVVLRSVLARLVAPLHVHELLLLCETVAAKEGADGGGVSFCHRGGERRRRATRARAGGADGSRDDDDDDGTMRMRMRMRTAATTTKSLRNGVHHANAVVWEPVS